MRHSISRTMLLFAAGLLLSGTASAQEVSQERIVKGLGKLTAAARCSLSSRLCFSSPVELAWPTTRNL